MLLKDMLDPSEHASCPVEFLSKDIAGIFNDSRKVSKGGLFVALAGPEKNGNDFIKDALSRGASVIVHKKDFYPQEKSSQVAYLGVEDPSAFLAKILKRFYANLPQKISLIGVTGTNGKTTITYLLESIFAAAGTPSGVIGTINHRFGTEVFKAANTTPGIIENYELLAMMAKRGMKYCAMEVSSHALVQRRVEGLSFNYAIFTNLTSDHLDYHQNREEYFFAKSKLFTGMPKTGKALINMDDEYGPRLKIVSSGQVVTYGLQNGCEITARNISLNFSQTTFDLVTPKGTTRLTTGLIGTHNIYNILAAAGVAVYENIPLEVIKKGIEGIPVVPGRLERIEGPQDYFVFVDYAHTEDALKNVLTSLKNVSKAKVIVVFGCGGNRDKTKRPKMAAVVEQLADWAIVTTDNPRGENPNAIIDEILAGFSRRNYQVVADREEAIRTGLQMAKKGDVVLIAGKGHEDYQIFKDKTIPFDERQIVRKILNRKEPGSLFSFLKK